MKDWHAVAHGTDIVALCEADVERDVKVRLAVGRLDIAVLPEVSPNRLPDVVGPDVVVGERVARNAVLIPEGEGLQRLQRIRFRVVRVGGRKRWAAGQHEREAKYKY
jgi:hypothetical protein